MTHAPDASTPRAIAIAPERRLSAATALAGAAAVALALLGASLSAGLLAPVTSYYILDYVQLAILAVLAAALWRLVTAVGNDDLAALAWRALFAGWASYLVGQACFCALRITGGTDTVPLPTVADVFFVAGQVLVLVALALHLVAHARIGLPPGLATFLVMALVVAAVGAWVGVGILAPLWANPAESAGTKAMTTIYEALDLLTLAAAVPLFRIALLLRGGPIAQGWAAIGLGFAFMMVADLMFGLHHEIAAGYAFVGSYTAIAFGVIRHRETIGRILVT
jgi:hypothetical protein